MRPPDPATRTRPGAVAPMALSAMRAVRLIGAATPLNGEAEIERLVARFSAGRPCLPRWEHPALATVEADARLDRLARACRDLEEPLRSLYFARIDELRLEAAAMAAVGQPALAALAARRFREGAAAVRAADALAARWGSASGRRRSAKDGDEPVPTDAADPRSLLSRVRAAIGAHRAPFSVRVAPQLGALAATGERTVYVAGGRLLGVRAARRVALHEVLGHVLPRVRAARVHPLFVLGTARGTDDQEGLALVYEERAGFLDAARRAELAHRHVAATAMHAGADFVEVVRTLGERGVALRESLVVASRVFRGSDGTFAGLGRERVYLPAFARVRARLRKDADAERILASGQVAVSALPALRQLLAGRQASPAPPPSRLTV